MTDLPDVARTDERFEIRMGGDVAFAEYRLKGDSVIFPHTVVPDAFSGQNYWPDALGRQRFYDPPERGFEREIRKRLEYWEKLRQERGE